VIVELPTLSQAVKVAALTGGRQLSATGPGKLSRGVDVGPGFEGHWEAIESVSVLYKLFDDHGAEVGSGWTISAAKFEVCWPTDPGIIWSHFGARRFAYN
jgi:putative transposase